MQTLLAMQGRELVIVNTTDTAEDDLMGNARGQSSPRSALGSTAAGVLNGRRNKYWLPCSRTVLA